VYDAVVGPAEAERLQLLVGIADEIAIGEEQQLDDIPAQIASIAYRRPWLGSVLRGSREIYVRHIDVSWVQCYKTISPHEILDRFVSAGSSRSGRGKPDRRRRPKQIYRAIVERHFGKTYWTSAFRKSMSSADMLATETGRNKAGGGPARNHIKPAGPKQGRQAPEQRRHRQREA
jgi:hypothetical protein